MNTATTRNRITSKGLSFIWCGSSQISAASSLLPVEDGKSMDRFKAAGLIQVKGVCVCGCDREARRLETSITQLRHGARNHSAADALSLVSRVHGDLPDVPNSPRHSRCNQNADNGTGRTNGNTRHERQEVAAPNVIGQYRKQLRATLLRSILAVDAAVVRPVIRTMDDPHRLRKVSRFPGPDRNVGVRRRRRVLRSHAGKHVASLQPLESTRL